MDRASHTRRHARWLLSCLLLTAMSTGCTQTGWKSPIWNPSKSTASTPAANSAFSSTTQSMKSQFASVGAAMSSAYTKTKTAITSPFSPASSTTDTETKEPTTSKSLSIAPEVLVAQGNYFESQGNYAKALDSYSRALEAESNNSAALMSLARLYDKQGDSPRSTEYYRKAIAATPASADPHAELGSVLARNGDLKGAQDELQKAVQMQPKNSAYRSSLAGVLLDSGNADAALQQLGEVETPAMAQYQLAYLHFHRKNIPATQQHLQQALQIDPNLKPARDLLASIGGGQNIQQWVQQGQQVGQQAMGIYQQTGALANNVLQTVGSAPAPIVASPPAAGTMSTLPSPIVHAPSTLPPAANSYVAPVHSAVPGAPGQAGATTGPYSPFPPTTNGTVYR